MTYAADRIHEEVAYVAYHFHWSFDELLDLEHHEHIAARSAAHTRVALAAPAAVPVTIPVTVAVPVAVPE